MKKQTYVLSFLLAAGLLTACQRTNPASSRTTTPATDAATMASGGYQTSDRSGQQPPSPDRAAANSPAVGAPVVTSTGNQTLNSHGTPMSNDTTTRSMTQGAAPNTSQGIWNNSTQVGNQPVPAAGQTTSASRNGVNGSPAMEAQRDAAQSQNARTGAMNQQPPAAGMQGATSGKVADLSRQIDEVDAELRTANMAENRKSTLQKKRQRLVKQLNKAKEDATNEPMRSGER
jgi:hypothetical protein